MDVQVIHQKVDDGKSPLYRQRGAESNYPRQANNPAAAQSRGEKRKGDPPLPPCSFQNNELFSCRSVKYIPSKDTFPVNYHSLVYLFHFTSPRVEHDIVGIP